MIALYKSSLFSIVSLDFVLHTIVKMGREFLTFMGPCIVRIFQYISKKMQRYTIYLYLETSLHVSGGTSTHHQERIQLYLQHLVFVKPLLLPAAIVPTLPRWRQVAVTVRQIPDAVDTVVCAPDDGWKYHPKHAEQLPDIINCVTLHLVGYTGCFRRNSKYFRRW